MANKTTKKTTGQGACEQYVVERLKETEQELNEMRVVNASLVKKYAELYNLVMNGLKTAKLKEDESDTFNHIQMFDTYVVSIYKDLSKEDDDTKAFIELVKFVERQVRREE